MTTLQAAVLGFVQGMSEFLPISSSGHLIVVPWLLHWPVQSLAFDVALHLGTLIAVVAAYGDDWARLLAAALRGARQGRPFASPEGRLLALLVVASVPAAVAGLLLEKWAATVFRSPALVAFDMAVMGAVLLAADRRAGRSAHDVATISTRDALLIGAAQALALVPGVSRSGATISAALYLGYRREEAARFSFLLAVPITFGAVVFKVPHLLGAGQVRAVLAGTATAAVFGLLSIRLLLAYVRTRDYRPFVYYRWAFALVVITVLLLRRV
ncbi:MAG TPA: undecaprenyl-diphosphate phosphatase [Vicinamibacteria bacterium]|jgi:undecaprenyl-diphosphatase|nr:undecaprenyl-diphosphate phosphatase [Vicinamibacteria bacterium]